MKCFYTLYLKKKFIPKTFIIFTLVIFMFIDRYFFYFLELFFLLGAFLCSVNQPNWIKSPFHEMTEIEEFWQ